MTDICRSSTHRCKHPTPSSFYVFRFAQSQSGGVGGTIGRRGVAGHGLRPSSSLRLHTSLMAMMVVV
ncbi:hypothetical protein HanIR_Chr07g0324011 [Helianthus annuus]|nr:hypothetical protein HanIR_Chr07g0324011 [Helianthus annuus]